MAHGTTTTTTAMLYQNMLNGMLKRYTPMNNGTKKCHQKSSYIFLEEIIKKVSFTVEKHVSTEAILLCYTVCLIEYQYKLIV